MVAPTADRHIRCADEEARRPTPAQEIRQPPVRKPALLKVASRARQGWRANSRRRHMATTKQRAATRRNLKKAASAANRKRTIAKLPRKTRRALGKQRAKVAKRRRRSRRRKAS